MRNTEEKIKKANERWLKGKDICSDKNKIAARNRSLFKDINIRNFKEQENALWTRK